MPSEPRIVFVLGSPRSGTTTMAHVLRQYLGLKGDDEGHIFTLWYQMIGVLTDHFSSYGSRGGGGGGTNTLLRIGRLALEKYLTRGILEALDLEPDVWWVDKTPGIEAIRAVRLLHRFLPSSKFIYMSRDGMNNVSSRMRKFPEVPFDYHCKQWSESVLSWLEMKQSLSDGAFLEIKSSELGEPPAPLMEKLAKFLEVRPVESPPARFPRLERTSYDDGPVEWSEDRVRTFLIICGPAMRALGHTVSELAAKVGIREAYGVTLPPPYGQAKVVMETEREEFISQSVEQDGVWIFLHPGQRQGEVTRLIYEDVLLTGYSTFRARVRVDGEFSKPVRFCLVVRQAAGGTVVASLSIICNCGEMRWWTEWIGPLNGRYQVMLSTEMANGDENDCAWAHILDPSFTATEALRESVLEESRSPGAREMRAVAVDVTDDPAATAPVH